MYKVTFYCYNGMSIPLGVVEREEAQNIVTARIKRARKNDQPVTRVDHNEWEFESPENAGSVSDSDGILKVKRVSR